jgi:hypothetical protein
MANNEAVQDFEAHRKECDQCRGVDHLPNAQALRCSQGQQLRDRAISSLFRKQ